MIRFARRRCGQPAAARRMLASGDHRFAGFTVRALCHNRTLPGGPRLEVMSGSIEERATAGRPPAIPA